MPRKRVSHPSSSSKAQPETDSAAAENQLAHISPVLFALILPALVGLAELTPRIYYSLMFTDSLILIPVAIIIKIVFDWASKNESFVICQFRYLSPLKYLENLPAAIIFKTERQKIRIPWITLFLIICNTVIFYAVSEDAARGYVFTPYLYWSLPRVLLSVFTSAFLHSSTAHLFSNMLFLLVFGSLVELKIGSKRFLMAYFLCQITAVLIDVLLLGISFPNDSLVSILEDFHALGASGAISGILGLFVVRCFSARLVLNGPFFSMPYLSIPIGILGTILSINFFAFDVQGSLTQLEYESKIDYWAHLGGYLGGFVLGYGLKLHKEACTEAQRVKSRIMSQKQIIQKGGQLHEAALKFLLNHYRGNEKKRELYFALLVQALFNNNFKKAIDTFSAHYPKYSDALPGDILMDIGGHFYGLADFEKARACWESAARKNGQWQGQAKLYLARRLGQN